jgi:hypothetical protein
MWFTEDVDGCLTEQSLHRSLLGARERRSLKGLEVDLGCELTCNKRRASRRIGKVRGSSPLISTRFYGVQIKFAYRPSAEGSGLISVKTARICLNSPKTANPYKCRQDQLLRLRTPSPSITNHSSRQTRGRRAANLSVGSSLFKYSAAEARGREMKVISNSRKDNRISNHVRNLSCFRVHATPSSAGAH